MGTGDLVQLCQRPDLRGGCVLDALEQCAHLDDHPQRLGTAKSGGAHKDS